MRYKKYNFVVDYIVTASNIFLKKYQTPNSCTVLVGENVISAEKSTISDTNLSTSNRPKIGSSSSSSSQPSSATTSTSSSSGGATSSESGGGGSGGKNEQPHLVYFRRKRRDVDGDELKSISSSDDGSEIGSQPPVVVNDQNDDLKYSDDNNYNNHISYPSSSPVSDLNFSNNNINGELSVGDDTATNDKLFGKVITTTILAVDGNEQLTATELPPTAVDDTDDNHNNNNVNNNNNNNYVMGDGLLTNDEFNSKEIIQNDFPAIINYSHDTNHDNNNDNNDDDDDNDNTVDNHNIPIYKSNKHLVHADKSKTVYKLNGIENDSDGGGVGGRGGNQKQFYNSNKHNNGIGDDIEIHPLKVEEEVDEFPISKKSPMYFVHDKDNSDEFNELHDLNTNNDNNNNNINNNNQQHDTQRILVNISIAADSGIGSQHQSIYVLQVAVPTGPQISPIIHLDPFSRDNTKLSSISVAPPSLDSPPSVEFPPKIPPAPPCPCQCLGDANALPFNETDDEIFTAKSDVIVQNDEATTIESFDDVSETTTIKVEEIDESLTESEIMFFNCSQSQPPILILEG